MFSLPLFLSTGTLRIFVMANFLAIFAMSWDALSGRTGYISFGAITCVRWYMISMKASVTKAK